MIRSGLVDRVIAGGAESTITPLGVAGFAAMKALSTRNDDPQQASRPFDVDRWLRSCGGRRRYGRESWRLHALAMPASMRRSAVRSIVRRYHMTLPEPNGSGARNDDSGYRRRWY